METSAGMRIWQAVQEITKGKPYVFVIREFGTKYALIREVVRPIVEEFDMACVDAEDVPGAGQDLLSKVHTLIGRAELVIAEVSHENPNVFYEIGYATALDKPSVFLLKRGEQMATDLRGRLHVEYEESPAGIAALKEDLRRELRVQLYSEVAILRDMLLPPTPQPAYVVASPKYPGPKARIHGQAYDRRTYGDNLGIRGLISAFGLMLGERDCVDLISAKHADPNLVTTPGSLYLIGSGKVNQFTPGVLESLITSRGPQWRLGAAPGEEEVGDYPMMLYRGDEPVPAEVTEVEEGTIFSKDSGLVVRGPHPCFPNDRLALVLAGAHSLGTGAACIAATSSSHIRQIAGRLDAECNVSIADKDLTFWALATGTADPHDNLLPPENVTIEEVGVY
ncbi:MAG: hypothetical protein U9R79_15230 [Armatimonadota bacterium]|nr:hypothetical protein [Armatimonadota bacterium]